VSPPKRLPFGPKVLPLPSGSLRVLLPFCSRPKPTSAAPIFHTPRTHAHASSSISVTSHRTNESSFLAVRVADFHISLQIYLNVSFDFPVRSPSPPFPTLTIPRRPEGNDPLTLTRSREGCSTVPSPPGKVPRKTRPEFASEAISTDFHGVPGPSCTRGLTTLT
jgi:hypothetical protein